ncbi:hypothetical protein A2W45_03855 [Candidatus Curtissbacteria bacterium RIFCSPHIGHO2_12_41_11]|uniref:DUF5671 domain-containing protein n=2 Tax=Candidatus Curtissiibacteriota TaxID=1752717 RepID=A0A1F5HQ24_9BACT|nr:MAG: hypothetical protein A2Z54_01180 [Candidatus Curtissbacteria bacterium RIFCSPHIGHO2_02_39_8]OGD98392.1 MAG: hypothetical protein A2W45_03855 [Candidatus Curtissbacteria bacterium RIFCSPHIGHO2_12_41_11]OGE06267.1 MAG: hypothetical protein A2W70_00315 [Candidatus Curtissbacteria bacterium RIFCSPLOWO2_02_41_11]
MKTSAGKIYLWIGVLWVSITVIIAIVFLAGNPHYFSSQEGYEKFTLYANVIGFLIWSIPGFVLIVIGKRKLKSE